MEKSYKDLYFQLFNALSDISKQIEEIQKDAEEKYTEIASEEDEVIS